LTKPDDTWTGENRLDRQNAVRADGFSTLRGDLDKPVRRRGRRRRRSWLLSLAVPLLLCLIGGAAVIQQLATRAGPH